MHSIINGQLTNVILVLWDICLIDLDAWLDLGTLGLEGGIRFHSMGHWKRLLLVLIFSKYCVCLDSFLPSKRAIQFFSIYISFNMRRPAHLTDDFFRVLRQLAAQLNARGLWCLDRYLSICSDCSSYFLSFRMLLLHLLCDDLVDWAAIFELDSLICCGWLLIWWHELPDLSFILCKNWAEVRAVIEVVR